VVQQPYSGLECLIVEISRSLTDTQHSLGFLWKRDRPVAGMSTWQHTTMTNGRRPWPRRNSNPSIPASERPQTDALSRAAIGISILTSYCVYIERFFRRRFSQADRMRGPAWRRHANRNTAYYDVSLLHTVVSDVSASQIVVILKKYKANVHFRLQSSLGLFGSFLTRFNSVLTVSRYCTNFRY